MNVVDLLRGGESPVFVFLVALLVGALHALEPGHSKTMIAAYIIAIKGSVYQAILLGVSAAISHSVVVWILAYVALAYGNELIGEQSEPYFMMLSGVLIIFLAIWMSRHLFKKKQHVLTVAYRQEQDHQHHHHDHHHHDENEHAKAHALQLEKQLANGKKGAWQTIGFGLTGGLLPCPAAITVFLLCLQLGKLNLGVALVGAFSIGLALALVSVGVLASMGTKLLAQKTSVFNRLLGIVPYFSGFLVGGIGLLMIYSGYSHLIAP